VYNVLNQRTRFHNGMLPRNTTLGEQSIYMIYLPQFDTMWAFN